MNKPSPPSLLRETKSYKKGQKLFVRAQLLVYSRNPSARDLDEAKGLYRQAAKLMERGVSEAEKSLRSEAKLLNDEYYRWMDMLQEELDDVDEMAGDL